MSSGGSAGLGDGATRRSPAGFKAAELLALTAAPTFAALALLTAALGGGSADMLCATAHGGSPLTGMPLMYALMGAFHAGPWLRLISRT